MRSKRKNKKVTLQLDTREATRAAAHVASITVERGRVRDALGALYLWGSGAGDNLGCLEAGAWLRQEHFMTEQAGGWDMADIERRTEAATLHAACLAGMVPAGLASVNMVVLVTEHAIRLRDADAEGHLGSLRAAQAEAGRVRDLYEGE